ncbi:hypothetical protein ACP70R_002908 [Stipagrostis hirtigluma subsp. patula]
MAGASTIRSLLVIVFLSLLVIMPLAARGGAARCPRVPSMTAERACRAVCGTRDMRARCRRTLSARRGGAAAVAVTLHAAAAARSALDSYAATAAAAASLVDGGAVTNGEKAAYGNCMVGYGVARGAMARVAGDLAADGCDRAADLKSAYMAGLRGMDRCRRSLFDYPQSPLYALNLADRNKTLLAALLCSLVPAPPMGGSHV